jgi:MarR family 2-MHQ and catechol resistance regulon transcriptional repressor
MAENGMKKALGAYTNLIRATESVQGLLSRQLGSLGLTMGQFQMLEALLHLGPMSPGTLCDKLLCGSSNLSMVIRNLQRRGLVVSRANERDERRKMVHLTPEGRAMITKVFPIQAKLIRAQMSALDGREQEILRRLCKKLGLGNPARFAVEMTKEVG